MRKRMNTSERILTIINYTILTLFTIITVYPMIHELALSFSSTKEALRPGIHIIPLQFSLDGYRKILSQPYIWWGYRSTILVTLVGTTLSMVFTILTAYPLSRSRFIFRNGFTFFIVFTMMFNGGIIPTFLLVKQLHLLNSYWSLILPGLVSAYNMVLMKNFFQTIPASLEESAKIDGANDFQVLFRLVLPLSTPVLATIALFYAVGNWNAFFDCLMYITNQKKYVLQVILRQIVVTNELTLANGGDDSRLASLAPIQDKASTILAATIPILIVYPFLQKYFVKGVLIGSVKG